MPLIDRSIYDSYRWRTKTQPQVISWNPQCQRLFDDGCQCQQPSKVVHHLRDPKDAPDKAYSWDNLVAVCADHHSGGQRGETQGYRYAATCGPLNQIYYHTGNVLPSGHPKWVKPAPGNIAALAGTSSTAVGDDAINKALGEWA